MKKLIPTIRICIFICCCVGISVLKAQLVTIPDANFLNWLNTNGYSQCIVNTNQLDSTCTAVRNATSVNVSFKNIADLTGIECFHSLTSLNCTSNLLDTIPPIHSPLVSLIASGNPLKFLGDTLPPTLITLTIINTQLDSLFNLPPRLVTLDCSSNFNLIRIVALPGSIRTLTCNNTRVNLLPTLPASLRQLTAYENTFAALPTLPDSLNYLNIDHCDLPSFPNFPDSLYTFQANFNTFPSLPPMNSSLNKVQASYNRFLKSLPALPDSLTELIVISDSIYSLPPLPAKLSTFSCGNNNLTVMPTIPDRVRTMDCSFNYLHSLPNLPKSLTFFIGARNPLDSLPPIPDAVTYFDCSWTNIKTLPAVPKGLQSLYCRSDSSLTTITNLPNSLNTFMVHSSPNLHCIPPLLKFNGGSGDFTIYGSGIKCLPNIIQHNGSIPAIDTVPVCNLLNQYGCAVGWNIEGSVYLLDGDTCPRAVNGKKLSLVKMNLYEGNNLAQSAYFPGSYSFITGFSTYRVEIDKEVPFISPCTMDTLITVTPTDSLHYNIDFGLTCKNGFDVGVQSITGRFRAGTTSELYVVAGDISAFYGGHCSSGVTGKVTLQITGPGTYAGPAPGALTPDIVNGNTLTWFVDDYETISPGTDFNILIKTDDNAPANSTVCIAISVTPKEGDINPINNSAKQCFTTRNSHDPNEKEAYPIGTVDTANKWITYTVHFQNTGNDTAFSVVVLDTLDDNVDPGTFQLLAYTNKVITRVEYKIVQFNFPYICLPDSATNKAGSQGYVQYRVKIRDNAGVGVQIKNSASIYFDKNEPILTNTTVNTIISGVFTSVALLTGEPEVTIYPNPANNSIHIAVQGFQPAWVSVTDVSGKKLSELHFAPVIDISRLNAGIYFIEVKGTDGMVVKRLMKL